MHLAPGVGSVEDSGSVDPHTRVGFVVSRAVGGAVRRNLVKRRLRALVSQRLDDGSLSRSSTLLVVRALPAAATSSFTRLGDDLDAALRAACTQRHPGARAAT